MLHLLLKRMVHLCPLKMQCMQLLIYTKLTGKILTWIFFLLLSLNTANPSSLPIQPTNGQLVKMFNYLNSFSKTTDNKKFSLLSQTGLFSTSSRTVISTSTPIMFYGLMVSPIISHSIMLCNQRPLMGNFAKYLHRSLSRPILWKFSTNFFLLTLFKDKVQA